MNNLWVRTIFSFFGLLLLQEFVFSNINLGIYINIYIYILFILLLPATYSPLAILALSGAMGLAVDVFSSGGVLGLHTSACLAMGFARPHILKMVSAPSDNLHEIPIFKQAEIRKVITYNGLLIIIHHAILFLLEAFSLAQLPYVLLRIVLSSIITMIFVIVFELFLEQKR